MDNRDSRIEKHCKPNVVYILIKSSHKDNTIGDKHILYRDDGSCCPEYKNLITGRLHYEYSAWFKIAHRKNVVGGKLIE